MKKSLADHKSYDEIYIDGLNLLARSFHGMDHLEYKGVSTGMIYGIARFFATYRKSNAHADIVFLWEGKNSWRKEKYPFYKAKRRLRSTDNAFGDGVSRVKELLPVMGIRQEWVDTMEADDLAYYHCKLTNVAGKKILMVSTDEDWYVCSRSNIDILYRHGIKTALKIDEELGFPSSRVPLYKSLKGCKTDEVSGVPRFLTRLAIMLVKECDNTGKFVETLESWGERDWAEKLEKHFWIVTRNEEIVTPSKICDKDIQKIEGQYDLGILCKALRKYGMHSIVESLGG